MILVANTECLGCNEPNQLTGVEVECALEADRLPIFFFFLIDAHKILNWKVDYLNFLVGWRSLLILTQYNPKQIKFTVFKFPGYRFGNVHKCPNIIGLYSNKLQRNPCHSRLKRQEINTKLWINYYTDNKTNTD